MVFSVALYFCFTFWDIHTVIGLYLVDNMPSFEEITCQEKAKADMCIKVSFSNGDHDILMMNRASKTSSIYEGILKGDMNIPAVVIDIPMHNKRFVRNIRPKNLNK